MQCIRLIGIDHKYQDLCIVFKHESFLCDSFFLYIRINFWFKNITFWFIYIHDKSFTLFRKHIFQKNRKESKWIYESFWTLFYIHMNHFISHNNSNMIISNPQELNSATQINSNQGNVYIWIKIIYFSYNSWFTLKKINHMNQNKDSHESLIAEWIILNIHESFFWFKYTIFLIQYHSHESPVNRRIFL